MLDVDFIESRSTSDVETTGILPTPQVRNTNTVTEIASNQSPENRQHDVTSNFNASPTINVREPLSERRKRRRLPFDSRTQYQTTFRVSGSA